MVARALGFIARNGPLSRAGSLGRGRRDQCLHAGRSASPRWSRRRAWLRPRPASSLGAVADYWNAHIEDWTAVYDTALARAHRRARLLHAQCAADRARHRSARAARCDLPIKNRANDPACRPRNRSATDFLQLVRIRPARRRRSADARQHPGHRCAAESGYAERAGLAPLHRRWLWRTRRTARRSTASGRGRAWPLLTGERGHYELAAGHDPLPYLEAMVAMSGRGRPDPGAGLGQRADPARGLYRASPAGRRCRSSGRMPNSSSWWRAAGWGVLSIGPRRVAALWRPPARARRGTVVAARADRADTRRPGAAGCPCRARRGSTMASTAAGRGRQRHGRAARAVRAGAAHAWLEGRERESTSRSSGFDSDSGKGTATASTSPERAIVPEPASRRESSVHHDRSIGGLAPFHRILHTDRKTTTT